MCEMRGEALEIRHYLGKMVLGFLRKLKYNIFTDNVIQCIHVSYWHTRDAEFCTRHQPRGKEKSLAGRKIDN